MDIAENVKLIRENMENAAVLAGRKVEEISLVAATKTNPSEKIRQAIAAGVDACGENRVQELTQKLSENAYDGAPVHFIGHLQKNKVRQVVGKVDLIQSVDSPELLGLISERARTLEIVQPVLIEINIAGENTKTGLDPEALAEILEIAGDLPGVLVRGLMAIPPISEKKGENRPYFARLYKLFVDNREKNYNNVCMELLSMGMSGDYSDAILEGANMIRVGSAIFGPRS